MNLLSTFQLHDEKTFYQTFLQDLYKCQNEVIIESPYITSERMRTFDRIFEKLLKTDQWNFSAPNTQLRGGTKIRGSSQIK